MSRLFDLDDIRMFTLAAQSGSLSGAAQELGVATSTVSRSLTRLERRLGLLLVRRGQRGLRLTDAGEEYFSSCGRALRTLREAGDLLEEHQSHPGGVIKVACPVTMARHTIAPLLSKFIQAYPDLRVELEGYSSGWDQEPNEDVDVFFKIRAPRDSSRKVRRYPGTARGLFATRQVLERWPLMRGLEAKLVRWSNSSVGKSLIIFTHSLSGRSAAW
jgi:DNA-binding transcriptional LysR family regulator